MRMLLIIILLFLLPVNAYCERNKILVNELHESANVSIIKHFVDDVMSLMPDDFRKRLDVDTIRNSVNFNASNNKWLKHSVMSENDLTNIYMKLSKNYTNNEIDDITLSDELGNTISTIVQSSMAQGSRDPLGEKLKSNLDKFLREEYKKTHIIEYDGYSKKDIKTCVSRIYELSKYDKDNIYPLMVVRTADLWATVHNAKVENISKVKKSFIRQPSNIAYTGRINVKSAEDQVNSISGQAKSNSSKMTSSDDDSNKSNEPETAIIILVPIRQ